MSLGMQRFVPYLHNWERFGLSRFFFALGAKSR